MGGVRSSAGAGLLKWVVCEHDPVVADDVVSNQGSCMFDVAVVDLMASMQNGATLVLNEPEQIKQHGEFTKHLAPLNPSVWVSTPSFLSLALLNGDFSAQDLPRLDTFYLAGEIVHHRLERRAHAKFPLRHVSNAYGELEQPRTSSWGKLAKHTLTT